MMCYTVPESEFYGIDLPAVVENEERALRMLGGVDEILNVFACNKKRLKFTFRPDMVFAKPASADGIPVTGLLLRVARRRNRKTGEIQIHPTIIGRVSRLYKFDAMFDFQYGPFERLNYDGDYTKPFSTSAEDNQFRVFYDTIALREPTTHLEPYLSRDAPLYLPPTVFSRTDVPFNYNFAPRHRSSEYVELEEKSQRLAVARKPRPNYGLFVKFTQPTPMEPNPLAVERVHKFGFNVKAAYDQLYQVFAERPVWIRGALRRLVGRKYRSNAFKFALLACAYYMVSGPWGRSWIRFGYDPRTEKNSRYFQVVDFRIHSHVLISKILQRSSGKTGNILTDTSRRHRFNRRGQGPSRWLGGDPNSSFGQSSSSVLPKGEQSILDSDDEETGAVEDFDDQDSSLPGQRDFYFNTEHLPTAQQTVYCLSDIDIPEVRAIIAEEPEQDVCDPVEGWLKPGSIKQIRLLMTQYLHKWLEQPQSPTK